MINLVGLFIVCLKNTSFVHGDGSIFQLDTTITTGKEFYSYMKMFIQSWLGNLSEDFYNLMLMLILSASIVIVIKTMMLRGAGSLGSLPGIYQGFYIY